MSENKVIDAQNELCFDGTDLQVIEPEYSEIYIENALPKGGGRVMFKDCRIFLRRDDVFMRPLDGTLVFDGLTGYTIMANGYYFRLMNKIKRLERDLKRKNNKENEK